MAYSNPPEQLKILEIRGFRIDYTNQRAILGFGDIPADSLMVPQIISFLHRRDELGAEYGTQLQKRIGQQSTRAEYVQELGRLREEVRQWARSLGGLKGVRHVARKLEEIIQ